MAKFVVEEGNLRDVKIITCESVYDERGSFTKIYERDDYKKCGIDFYLNETFISVSRKNVIRGMHFQTHIPQAKIVSVLKGHILDVAIDLRKNSSTYKKWIAVELSAENNKQLYVPRGFAHGFLSLENDSTVLYQCEGKYDKNTDSGIVFDDNVIGIDWPVKRDEIIVSERDRNLMDFYQFEQSVDFD